MTDSKIPVDLDSDADAKYFAQLTDEVNKLADELLPKLNEMKDPYFAARILIWELMERAPQLFRPHLLRNCADVFEQQSALVSGVLGNRSPV